MKSQRHARVFFWNRKPGVFVNKTNGTQVKLEGISIGPQFTGSGQEWYETLIETIIDMRNHLQIDARCQADRCTVTCDPDVFCMLQASVLFRRDPNDPHVGTISSWMKVIEDRSQERFQLTVEVEYKLSGRTHSQVGFVRVLED